MVYSQDVLDRTFHALANPTRRAMLARLALGETPIGELARPFAMSLPAASKHVRVLERAGLAAVRRDGRVRRCRLAAAPLRDAAEWMEHYRRFWEEHLDHLAAYLSEATPTTDESWPTPDLPTPDPPPTQSSKSAAPSRRHPIASLRRGPRRKS